MRSANLAQLSLSWPVHEPALDQDLLSGPVAVSRAGAADQVPGAGVSHRESWWYHRRRLGSRPHGGPWLVDAAASEGLSGCGGGCFPAARKWRAALSHSGPVQVVANAAESEPLSAKDSTLLRLRPHLVLDGLATLSETLAATHVLLWMHDSDTETRLAVSAAVRERRRAGLDELPVSIRAVDGGYLSGESSAIKHALDGGPVVPRFQGLDPSGGRDDRTVVVHNVETLARLSMLGREPLMASSPGQPRGPSRLGSRLLTVLTPQDRRVIEVPDATRLGEAVASATGRQPPGSTAVLLAGFGGTWARWSDVAGLPVDECALRNHGLTLGPGIIAPLWDVTCGISVTAAIANYLAAASARQCGPCLYGLPALAAAMTRLRDGTVRRSELTRLRADLAAVDGRGACHHPDGAARLIRSSLRIFRGDVAAHAAGSPCGHPAEAIPVPER